MRTFDAAAQISAFRKLKLRSCARPESRAGFLFGVAINPKLSVRLRTSTARQALRRLHGFAPF
jgi:hypothetical protein